MHVPGSATYAALSTVTTGAHRHVKGDDASRYASSMAAGAAFVAAVFATVAVVIVSSVVARPIQIPAWVGDDPGARCLRASRESNFALVSMSIGTPPRIVRILLRGDTVVPNATTPSTTLFSDHIMRSESMHCEQGQYDRVVCSDVASLTRGVDGTQQQHHVTFGYDTASAANYASEMSVGADGSMRLSTGTYYELTGTHLCWTTNATGYDPSSVAWDNKLGIHVTDDGATRINATVTSMGLPASACNNTDEVALWPVEATNERRWLALPSDFLYEASGSRLEERRIVVERGSSCAEDQLYMLECGRMRTCQSTPSLPFRRLSKMRLGIDLRPPNTLYANEETSLTRLSGSSMSESVFFALTRLFVLLIVAFVVYSRSDRQSTSSYFALRNAINVASGSHNHGFHSSFNAIADACIGTLAFVSRATVLVVQTRLLMADGNGILVVTEICGTSVSILHFVLRNFVLRTDLRTESPLTKLGGSMAISDASVAALVSVTVAPVLAASNRNFDAVARLFCGVLIAVFVFPRMWAGAAASALLASTTARDGGFDAAYPIVLISSSVLWIVQSVSVGVAVTRLFVLPQAYSLSRNVDGNGLEVTILVALMTLALTAHPLNTTNVRLKQDRMHVE
jgi:hypothetical protein